MATPFETFVNTELPKRIATNESPTTPQAGDIPTFTGVGLLTESKTTAELGLVTGNAAITGATKTKVTYDSKGLVTGGEDATTADINDSTDKRYVTDAQRTRVNTAASSGVDGYLTGSDWTTFNGKQAALVSGTNIKSVNGSSLLGSGDLVIGEQSVVLLEQNGFQTLSVGKRHYLPYITTPYTLNLNAPTGAAIGDWFILESRYSAALDGIGLSAFLLGINLKMASGEFVTGYGDIVSPATIPLLDVYNNSTNSPNFTSGCSFRFTKVTATTWALQPTYGAVMPERFHMKVSGTNFGGTLFVSTAVAGTYATVTLPTKDANLGDLSFVATTDSNTLGGTRTHIIGGSSNDVGGTDNMAIGCSSVSLLYGTGVVFCGCTSFAMPSGVTINRVQFRNFTSNLLSSTSFYIPEYADVLGSKAGVFNIRSAVSGSSVSGTGTVCATSGNSTKPLLCANGGLGLTLASHKCVLFAKRADGEYADYLVLNFRVDVKMSGGNPIITTTVESALNPTSLSYTLSITKQSGTFEMNIACNIAGADYDIRVFLDSTYMGSI